MLDYDPVKNIQHYPIAGGMRRFGLNPYGEPLYRVVFAPSRRYLVVGETGASWCTKYKGLITEEKASGQTKTHSRVWIMERWLSAIEYHKFGRADWEMNCLALGPWPEKGEYELCYMFYPAPPADVSIEYRIKLIEESRRVPFMETRTFHRRDSERQERATDALADDMIRSRFPAFGVQPLVGYGGARGTKTAPIIRTAEELGMPTRPGMVSNGNRKNNPVTRLIESAA